MEWINEALHATGVAPAPHERVTPVAAQVGEGFALPLSREEARRVETDFKYEGYLQQQEKQIERMRRAEARRIPDWFDYRKVSGLSREVTEKLLKVRPLTLGQALRIPGVTPAAVSLLNVYIEIFQRRAGEQATL